MRKVFAFLLTASLVFAYFSYEDVVKTFQYAKIMTYYGMKFDRAALLAKVLVEEHKNCPEIDPLVVLAVIYTESSFRNVFGDHGKAVGYMQLHIQAMWYVASFYDDIRSFARRLKNFKDLIKFPAMQIRIGYRYLCLIYRRRAKGDLVAALKMYNGTDDLIYPQRVFLHFVEIVDVLKLPEEP